MKRKQKQEPEHSPAWQLLAHVWKYNAKHSWRYIDRSMSRALSLAIQSGCEFDVGDFAKLGEGFTFGRWWWGANIIVGEHCEYFYGLAVAAGNLSAAKAIEAHKGRDPFIADEVRTDGGSRQRERLALGFSFPWQGEEVKVTSFSDDGTYLTACSYRPHEDRYSNKVLHRYTITAADIRADRKDRKRRDALEKVARGLTTAKRTRVLRSLGYSSGIITGAQWAKLSPERIEAAIKEVS